MCNRCDTNYQYYLQFFSNTAKKFMSDIINVLDKDCVVDILFIKYFKRK